MVEKELQMLFTSFFDSVPMKKNQILVLGVSTSEILGNEIGKGGSLDIAKELFEVVYTYAKQYNIHLAVQCCEHLNRAIVTSKVCRENYGLTEVSAMPHEKAGGAFATVAYENIEDVVLVESIQAHAGIDIGGTLIGMHLKEVAVPVKLGIKKIGQAPIVVARTRPKYIGGERAKYKK